MREVRVKHAPLFLRWYAAILSHYSIDLQASAGRSLWGRFQV